MSDTTLQFPFSEEAFRSNFGEVRRLVLEEWPQVDSDALETTEGDPHEVITLITTTTGHSRVLVRKHLAEIAEVAGVEASGLEARLVRLLHYLEDRAEPVGQEAKRVATQMRDQGEKVGRQVAGTVHEAEDKMKENLWVSLLAAMGLGVLAGLLVGLTRGR